MNRMNTSIAKPGIGESVPPNFTEDGSVHSSLDRTLTEIRSGRRLEKIVVSIESFLNSQVARLDKAIAECNQSVENDRIVQGILAEFELEKAAWEKSRQQEIKRLQAAGEELIKGWKNLENERSK